MATQDAFDKLAGQVQGLEMVLKSLVELHLATRVKDEAGFTKAAELAMKISQRLQAQVDLMGKEAERQSLSMPTILTAMRATVARCYDQPAENLTQIAQIVLDLSEPATPATH